jgi:hypothetical protein
MGAVTVAIVKRQMLGGTARNVIADVTWSGAYAAGGDTYTPSQFGLTTVNAIVTSSAGGAASTGYTVVPDLTNNKLKLQGGAASGVGLAEASGNQSATVARVLAIGDAPYV